MAQQTIALGSTANDGTGTTLRDGGGMVNANFTELYATKADKASPAFTGTPSAPTAAPGTNTTQIATTAFVAALVASATTRLLDLKGSTDCSANPNYPAASKGDTYIVSVAGKIGGASGTAVDAGDVYIAAADNAGGTQAAVGTSWFALEHDLSGAMLAANNLSDLANAAAARANLGIRRQIPSGRYLVPEGVNAFAVGTAGGTGSMRGFIGWIREAITITDLHAFVGVAAASGNAQFAVYAADATTLAPTGAALYSSANISTAAAVVVSATGMTLTLGPGYYWFFTNCDASAATAAFYSASATGFGQAAIIGGNTALSVFSGITGHARAQAFNSWPTLTGSLSADSLTPVATASVPVLLYRPT